jgi:hypothetical protein
MDIHVADAQPVRARGGTLSWKYLLSGGGTPCVQRAPISEPEPYSTYD